MRGLAYAVLAVSTVGHRVARAEPSIRVSFETTDPAAELVESTFIAGETPYVRSTAVCRGPCTTHVERTSYFHVEGAGVTPTPTFWLPAGEYVRVRARTGSQSVSTFGELSTGLGLVDTAVGVFLLGIHLAGRPIDAPSDLRTGAFWTLGTGAAMLAIGLPLMLISRTRVTTD